MRHVGTFSEVYELEEFPFDKQGLTLTLNFNARVNGPLPMELHIAEDCIVTMTCI